MYPYNISDSTPPGNFFNFIFLTPDPFCASLQYLRQYTAVFFYLQFFTTTVRPHCMLLFGWMVMGCPILCETSDSLYRAT